MASKTPQFLNAPGDVTRLAPGPSITRYPLVYSPSSSTQLNHERLPPPQELHGMDLAYREQLYTDEQIREYANGWATGLIIFGSFGTILLVLARSILSTELIFLVTGALAVGALVFKGVTRRSIQPSQLRAALVGPGLAAVLIPLVADIMRNELVAALVFGIATLIAFSRLGVKPFEFYQGWLAAHPRLRPTTREKIKLQRLAPDYVTLGIVLLLVVIGSLTAVTVALVGLLVLGVVRTWRTRLAVTAADILGRYVTYGEGTTGAPGVWHPADPIQTRQRYLLLLTVPLYLTLAGGLSLFVPVEFVRDWLPPQRFTRVELVEAIFFRKVQYPPTFLVLLPLFGLVYALTVPNLLLLAILRPALLGAARLRREIEGDTDADGAVHGGLDDDGRTEWQWYVDRVRTSPHSATDPLDPFGAPVREANHLFLGVEPNFKYPVLLDRKILGEHCYIVGETGSGKTSLGIMPLVLQLLRGSEPRDEEGQGSVGKGRPAILVLDLKGDPALFHTLREECGNRIPFRFFTPQPKRASHYFNAFRELRSDVRSTIQLAQLVLDSLALSHGEGYGRSYYSRQSRHALLAALKKHPNLQSFQELYDVLESLKRDKKDAFELISTIHALTFYPQLLSTPGRDVPDTQVIHMPRVLEEGQVIYFWLPAALESASVREIGKLALYALFTAAIDRQHAGRPQRQAYVVIDEFQRLAGENFKIILEQARSFGLSAILANQTQSDLQTPDVDLRPTIRTNTRLKLSFTVSDPAEVRTLMEGSGEEIAVMRAWSSTSEGLTETWSEAVKPRLTRNDILTASDHPLHFITQVSRGSGYTQFAGVPIPVRSTFPLSQDVYRERSAKTWPSTPTIAEAAMPIEEIERLRVGEAATAFEEQKAKLEKLVRDKGSET